MVCYETVVKALVADVFRELEIDRYDGVLPGNILLGQRGVVIPVAMPYDPVVERVVHQFQPLVDKSLHLCIVLGQEADVEVGGVEGSAPSVGRYRLKGLGHVLYRVWVGKALAEHNHVVGNFRLFRIVPFPDKPSFFGAAKGGEGDREESDKSFHSHQFSFGAKLEGIKRFKKFSHA